MAHVLLRDFRKLLKVDGDAENNIAGRLFSWLFTVCTHISIKIAPVEDSLTAVWLALYASAHYQAAWNWPLDRHPLFSGNHKL